jgi:hypothetical protein
MKIALAAVALALSQSAFAQFDSELAPALAKPQKHSRPKPEKGLTTQEAADPDQYERWILERGHYAVNAEASQGAPAGRFRILTVTPKGEAWLQDQRDPERNYARRHILVIPQEKRILNLPFSQNFYMAERFEAKEIGVIDGRWLKTTSDQGVLFMDTTRVYPVKKEFDDLEGFVQAGEVGFGSSRRIRIEDRAILPHALELAGFDAQEIKAAQTQVTAVLPKSGTYVISGSHATSLFLTQGTRTWVFWPKLP